MWRRRTCARNTSPSSSSAAAEPGSPPRCCWPARASTTCSSARARARRTCRRRTCSTSGRWRSSRTAASPTRSRAQHAGRADGGHRLLRGLRRTGRRVRPSARAARGVGRRRRERELARGEPVAPAQPPADPPRADPQGGRRSSSRRDGSASTTSCSSSSRTTTACRALVRDNGTGERVRGALRLPARRGRRTALRGPDRRQLRGAGRRDADGDAARERRLLALGARPRRPDPLDRLAAERDADRDGADGARALGAGLGGVGHPPELPGRRPARAVGREGRGRRPRARSACPTCR